MELHAKDGAPVPDRGGKAAGVVRARGHDLVGHVVGEREGVREVDVRALGHAREERARVAERREVELVPAHMGHLEARGLQARGTAAQHAQAIGRRAVVRLGAVVKEELEPQADPQKRRAAANRGDNGLALAALAQVAHRVAEAAHAGQHERRGSRDRGGVVAHERRAAGLDEPALHRAQVALVIVNDHDRGRAVGRARHSEPFVDGTPSTRGSGSTAARRARAAALNVASMM